MLVIDTNVYSALDHGVSSAINVLKGQSGICVPIFVVGELRYGFMNGDKQNTNEIRLEKFLAQTSVEVALPTLQTAALYAEFALRCRRLGRALSHNDIWIAALAKENDMQLATYDNDFEVFADIFGKDLSILTS